MSQKLKDILIVLLLVITFVVILLKVEHCKPNNNTNITNSDTVVEHKIDTFYAPQDTVYLVKFKPSVTDSFYVYDTLGADLCNYVREYKDTINDTNLTIYYEGLVRGKLLESGISYKLKIPIRIVDNVTTTITNTVEPKTQLYTGLTLSRNIIAPMIGIQKNSLYLHGGYNIIEKQPIIYIGYKFYSK